MKLKAPRFTADQFTSTKYKGLSAADKSHFANALGRFIVEGMPENRWTKALYRQLMQCFQHIAHYNAYGFYTEWFTTAHDRARFIENILQAPCYGTPDNTRCDVEKAIQKWVREAGLREHFGQLAAIEANQVAKTTITQLAGQLSPSERVELIKELNKQ